MSYTIDLSKIQKACKFTLEVDEKKGTVLLCGICKIKDENGKTHTFKRCMDLKNLIQNVADRIEEARQRLETYSSGPLHLTIEHSGGWLADTYSKAVNIAKKVGENRIAQDIYNDVLPEVAEYIPGGTTALNIAHKAHDVVVKAKEGYPEAKEKIQNLIVASKSSVHSVSDAASQVISMMKGMSRLIDMKQDYEHDRIGADNLRSYNTDHRKGHPKEGGKVTTTTAPNRRRGTNDYRGSSGDHRTQAPPPAQPMDNGYTDPYTNPYGQDPYGMTPYQPYGQDPNYMGYPPANPYGYPPPQYGMDPYEVANMMMQQSLQAQNQASEDAQRAYVESLFDPTSENYVRPIEEDYQDQGYEDQYIQGWLRNKPYRDPLTYLSQVTKDPGFIHRYLYNRGMGRG